MESVINVVFNVIQIIVLLFGGYLTITTLRKGYADDSTNMKQRGYKFLFFTIVFIILIQAVEWLILSLF
ncbi:MAG: hypothetical protein NXI20_17210 [bacterium]|nr:hypothetical protein [bacterium]